MSQLTVQITPNYRLTADDRQYVLQRKYIVDPTKAPGYKAEPNVPAPELRETWRDDGYYSLNSDGLIAAVQYVIIRTVNERGSAATLAELLREYRDEAARLRITVENTLKLAG